VTQVIISNVLSRSDFSWLLTSGRCIAKKEISIDVLHQDSNTTYVAAYALIVISVPFFRTQVV